ncbi:MAG TPA: pyruvate carboxylase [Pirellulales bacterium]|jgi:pyruvate carboxylase|nr:pyruvate carboxylase [Pirellulales bacterium]
MTATIRKLLVANRSEIAIRVFRTAHELGIRTVAVYSHEDRYALHRFKADEAYQVGQVGEPIRAYLDVDGIVSIAVQNGVEAIHPGYGFLSENPALARACRQAGIIFCGPPPEILEKLGDKIEARGIAAKANAPILAGSTSPLKDATEAQALAEKLGYPVLLKAAKGGGGRGMRVVKEPGELAGALEQAQRESQSAFGSTDVFLEKYIQRPRHIEVQLIGDKHGNLVHLFERDCSVQRRYQKVVEIAPAINLDPALRDAICEAALNIGRAVNYESAGTVEFLVDADTGKFYFIEVNPRIQVEHTVTEAVTGVDVVKSQILVAEGRPLSDPEIGLGSQQAIRTYGFALQCRVTTEDPENRFLPDYGRIAHYRSAGGIGVRLDAGTAFSGAMVTPFYDSLLVKVTAWGPRFADAARRMERGLQEFRVRGVKTNIPFLVNLVTHPKFIAGGFTTRFIDDTPELFDFAPRQDRATKLFGYLADVIVNGHPLVKERPGKIRRDPPPVPVLDRKGQIPPGTRQQLLKLGPKKFCDGVLAEKKLLLTDTTFRDAHQSLLATRLRTHDMLAIAETYARMCSDLFSIEMWGGATFDTAMRFLKECPWQRLADLRERIPNVLFQMLLRASNALGYANYPDNVVKAFVQESAQAGIDVFRIFDSLNWVPNMTVAMDAVLGTDALCEAAICYTGDILDKRKTKYDLKYYVELAKQFEKMGAHILGIKDMAGLCKPYAAELLVRTLKQEIGIPIHFHTHDTSGVQAAAILKAAEGGVDIADAAISSMSGLTSQPDLNSVVESLRYTERDTRLDFGGLQAIARYWEAVREFYSPFEAGMVASTADVYLNEIPGGQYTNLFQQARAVGLGARWPEICRTYAEVNELFGDIVKVTPSSKAVGDMAIFMITNDLTVDDVLDPGRELAFPESVVDLISGRMGQPPGGFPPKVIERVLRGQKPMTDRPGAHLAAVDFKAVGDDLRGKINREPTKQELLSYLVYPKVFLEFEAHEAKYADVSVLPTDVFFYGQEPGQEVAVEIERGKTLIVKFLTVGDPHPDGRRTVFFELNGQPRSINVRDVSLEPQEKHRAKADRADKKQVGSPMPGLVVTVSVKVGDKVPAGQKLLSLEAMKMETTLYAEQAGKVAELLVKPGTQVDTNDLLIRFE